MTKIPIEEVIWPQTDSGLVRVTKMSRECLQAVHTFDRDLVQKSMDCESEEAFFKIVDEILSEEFEKNYQRFAKLLELVMINDLFFRHKVWKARISVLDIIDKVVGKGK